MDVTSAIQATDATMASKRGYVKVACQHAVKDQNIILPCSGNGLGKFVLVFFSSDMRTRLRVETVSVLDPNGVGDIGIFV